MSARRSRRRLRASARRPIGHAQPVDRADRPADARAAPRTGGRSTAPRLDPGGRRRRPASRRSTRPRQALADDLMRIPGIQRFGDMRLGDLEPPARARCARCGASRATGSRAGYGEMTIGEIIDRYRGTAEAASRPAPDGAIGRATDDVAFDGEYERILEQNERFTEAFDRSALTAAPLTGLAILTCMDARIDVEDALGLRVGDAHIIRNAGGARDRRTRSARSSSASSSWGRARSSSSPTRGCGLHGADEAALRERIERHDRLRDGHGVRRVRRPRCDGPRAGRDPARRAGAARRARSRRSSTRSRPAGSATVRLTVVGFTRSRSRRPRRRRPGVRGQVVRARDPDGRSGRVHRGRRAARPDPAVAQHGRHAARCDRGGRAARASWTSGSSTTRHTASSPG